MCEHGPAGTHQMGRCLLVAPNLAGFSQCLDWSVRQTCMVHRHTLAAIMWLAEYRLQIVGQIME